MNEWVEAVVGVFTYSTAAGATFRYAANRSEYPDQPLKEPGPFFTGVFWWITIPAMIGQSLIPNSPEKAKSKISKASTAQRIALDEAIHRKEMAKIDAERVYYETNAMMIAEKGVGLELEAGPSWDRYTAKSGNDGGAITGKIM
jgi:hypothetical protein